MKIDKCETFNIDNDELINSIKIEISGILNQIDIEETKIKVSKEKTMPGRMLYSPVELNTKISDLLIDNGWQKGEGHRINIPLSSSIHDIKNFNGNSHSFKEMDFLKKFGTYMIGAEVQLGKYAFSTSDTFFKAPLFIQKKKIDIYVAICLMKKITDEMSTGVGRYEQSLPEIVLAQPSHPIILIGIC